MPVETAAERYRRLRSTRPDDLPAVNGHAVAAGRPERPPRGNPWVAALHAFVDAQAASTAKLTPNARTVWHYLHRHADGRDGMKVRQGIEQAVQETGLRRRTLQFAIAELVEAGYLERKARGQRQRGVTIYVVRGSPKA